MTCPYVTRLVEAAESVLGAGPAEDVLLVPGGCDAMRRFGDLLAATYPGRVFIVSLARSSTEEVVRALAADLARLGQWLTERAANCPAAQAGAASNSGRASEPTPVVRQTPRVDYPAPPRPGGVFVVAGPLTDDSLLRLIERLGSAVSGLESCTSPDRWKALAAAGHEGHGGEAGDPAVTGAAGAAGDDSYFDLARETLALGICPRRSSDERRSYLARRLDESRPSSVIYARQSFCDPGAYDAVLVSRLAQERGLPYLEIEVGFPFEASGPLRTRVEAFLEAQLLDEDLLDDVLDEEE
jgi:hypothetical protein